MSPNASTTSANTTIYDCNNNDCNNNFQTSAVVKYGSVNAHESESSPSTTTTINKSSSATTPSHQTNNIGILVTAFLAALASGGPTYAFGLYSQQLKYALELTQTEINTLSSATFCAGLLSWIPGMVVDRYGSRLGMIIGGTIESFALMAYYMTATYFALHHITSDVSVPILSIIGILIFMSNSLVIGSLFKMIVQTSHHTKGSAVGAAKGYLGLGAGVYSVLFDCLEVDNTLLFLPMASILCFVAIVIPAICFVPTKQILSQRQVIEISTSKHFRIIYFGLVVLASLVIMTSFKSLMEGEEEFDVFDNDEVTNSTTKTKVLIAANNNEGRDDDDDDEPASRLIRAVWVLLAWFIPIFALFAVSPSLSSNDKVIAGNNNNSSDDVVVVVGDENHYDDEEDNSIIMTSISPSSLKNKDNGETTTTTAAAAAATTTSNSYSFPKEIDYETGEYSSSTTNNKNADNNILLLHDNNESEEGDDDIYKQTDDDECVNESKQFIIPSTTNNTITSPNINNSNNDYTLPQMLQTSTAWYFCWTCIIIVGSGTIMTNNMGQMVESLGFAPRTASASLAFFSVAQALARVGVGTVSDATAMMDCNNSSSSSSRGWKKQKKCCCKIDCSHFGGKGAGIPRPAFLVVSCLIGMTAHAILASVGSTFDNPSSTTSLEVFVVGVVCSGIAFGMIWPLMVLIVGEVFGTKYHGANYMFYDGITSAMGTLLISNFLASAVYERNINSGDGLDDVQQEQQQQFTCYGRDCFGWSHVIIVGLLATCLATSIAVWKQTVSTYRKQYIGTPRMQRIRSNDELYGSPYRTWRKRDAIRYS